MQIDPASVNHIYSVFVFTQCLFPKYFNASTRNFLKDKSKSIIKLSIFLKKSILKYSLQKGMIFCIPYKKVSVGLKMYFTIANVVTGLLCTNQEVFQQLIEQSLSVNCSSNLIYCIMHCAGKRHLKKDTKELSRNKSLTVIKISLSSYPCYFSMR